MNAALISISCFSKKKEEKGFRWLSRAFFPPGEGFFDELGHHCYGKAVVNRFTFLSPVWKLMIACFLYRICYKSDWVFSSYRLHTAFTFSFLCSLFLSLYIFFSLLSIYFLDILPQLPNFSVYSFIGPLASINDLSMNV